MKNQFYLGVIIVGLLASSCSPSTPSDSEVQMNEDTLESTAGIEESSSSTAQNFKPKEKLSLQSVTFTISATNKQQTL